MFKFLKEKLKKSVGIFSKNVEEEGEEEIQEIEKEETNSEPIEEEQPVEATPEVEEPEKDLKDITIEKDEVVDIDDAKKQNTSRVEVETEVVELPKAEEKESEEITIEDTRKTVPEKIEVEQEITEAEPEVTKEEETQVDNLIEQASSPFEKIYRGENVAETPFDEEKPQEKDELPKQEEEKKGFFRKIKEKVVTKKINEQKFDELFWELELALLENNVAVQVIEKIKEDLKKEIVDVPIHRSKIEHTILHSLKNSIEEILTSDDIDIFKRMEEHQPYIICFVGINGSGKTTSIAKVAKMLLSKNKSVIMAAADTFRAAAIDQLQVHADNLGVHLVRQDYGSDPAAVAYDAVQYAQSKNIDVVLIDTAGRLHSNVNLIDEMKKIIRVANPHLKVFVGESITGNDCVEQAEKFNDAIIIDGIILSKADIDEKGGAAISVSYVTQKPILYLGTGQEYEDLKHFDKHDMMQSLGLEG